MSPHARMTHALVERHRDDARSERDALRVTHADQLAQAQRNADDRVQTLTEALTVAREAAATYLAQLAPADPIPSSAAAETTHTGIAAGVRA